MSSFKITKKNALSDNRSNIYDLHEKKLEYFNTERKKLDYYIKEKEKYVNQLNEISGLPSNITKKNELHNKINDLTIKIDNIENDKEQTKYLLDFLCIVNKNGNGNTGNTVNTVSTVNTTNTGNTVNTVNNGTTTSTGNMDLFVSKELNTCKSELYNDYIRNFYPLLTQISIPKKGINCKLCKSESFIYDSKNGNEVCIDCGLINTILLLEDPTHSYNENIEQINVFNYKRHNHFQECLNQLQAKENTTIPPKIIKDLTDEFKKYNITDKKIITPVLVKNYLKKLRYNKYYEHIPTIINELCGIDAPKLTPEFEEQLKIMFDEIQVPFEKYSKIVSPDRKNFLNYNYIFYKMCELLNKDEFLNCFPLLKSREKLYEHDLIWKGICNDLRWEFIPSI